jgi:hypothetical protein
MNDVFIVLRKNISNRFGNTIFLNNKKGEII